jgi:hypothetical protein
MSDPKIYLPKTNCKETVFRDGGTLIKLNFHAETLIEFVKANTNAKGYITFDLTRRKEVGKFGETHCLTLNTWQSGQNSQGRQSDAPSDQPTAAQRLLEEKRRAGQSKPSPSKPDQDDDVNF